MDIEKTKRDLEQVIEALLECDEKNRNCRKCKKRKNGCLLFMRDSIAVALQFIVGNMGRTEPRTNMFS